MSLKNIICRSFSLLSVAISANVYVIEAVPYHCPSVDQVDGYEVRTTISKKDVNWYVESKKRRGEDKATEFMASVLSKKSNDSYDMSVMCIYRSEHNNKLVYRPASSFRWYVDGVAEKPIGNGWQLSRKGSLVCSSSVNDCGFYFR